MVGVTEDSGATADAKLMHSRAASSGAFKGFFFFFAYLAIFSPKYLISIENWFISHNFQAMQPCLLLEIYHVKSRAA